MAELPRLQSRNDAALFSTFDTRRTARLHDFSTFVKHEQELTTILAGQLAHAQASEPDPLSPGSRPGLVIAAGNT